MIHLRRLGLSILTFILTVSLLGFAASGTMAQTIRDKEKVKDWLNESGFYDEIVNNLIEQAKAEGQEKLPSSVNLDDPAVQTIINDAFNPTLLQGLAEQIVDSTYLWLDGNTDKPEYKIALGDTKNQLASNFSTYAAQRVTSLPACTPVQMGALSTAEINFMTISCRPTGVNSQQIEQSVRTEVLNGLTFLPDNYAANDTTLVQENNNWPTQLQKAYQQSVWLPYAFLFLAILSTVGVIFLSSTRRKGLYRAGGLYIGSSVIVALTSLVLMHGPSQFNNLLVNIPASQANTELILNLVRVAGKDISRLLWWYVAGYILVGGGALLYAKLLLPLNKEAPTSPAKKDNDINSDKPTTPPLL